jgi:CxxC motif-containing protein (DUF1111 family)
MLGHSEGGIFVAQGGLTRMTCGDRQLVSLISRNLETTRNAESIDVLMNFSALNKNVWITRSVETRRKRGYGSLLNDRNCR